METALTLSFGCTMLLVCELRKVLKKAPFLKAPKMADPAPLFRHHIVEFWIWRCHAQSGYQHCSSTWIPSSWLNHRLSENEIWVIQFVFLVSSSPLSFAFSALSLSKEGKWTKQNAPCLRLASQEHGAWEVSRWCAICRRVWSFTCGCKEIRAKSLVLVADVRGAREAHKERREPWRSRFMWQTPRLPSSEEHLLTQIDTRSRREMSLPAYYIFFFLSGT